MAHTHGAWLTCTHTSSTSIAAPAVSPRGTASSVVSTAVATAPSAQLDDAAATAAARCGTATAPAKRAPPTLGCAVEPLATTQLAAAAEEAAGPLAPRLGPSTLASALQATRETFTWRTARP
eukprot:293373-Chlamydomonas_euryale.AAC.3